MRIFVACFLSVIFLLVLGYAQNAHSDDYLIGFGCCLVNPQTPFWAIAQRRGVNKFIVLGDFIYIPDSFKGERGILSKLYEERLRSKELVELITQNKIIAIWDDHDFGSDNSDSSYPFAKASRKEFKRFLGAPRNPLLEPRNSAASFERLSSERILHIALDNRSFRQNGKIIFGEPQLLALREKIINQKYEVLIISQGHSFLSAASELESLFALRKEFDAFIEILRLTSKPIILLSGDAHYAAVREYVTNGLKLIELVSSPLSGTTRTSVPEDKNRKYVYNQSANMGLLKFSFSDDGFKADFEIINEQDESVLDLSILNSNVRKTFQ